MQTTNFSGLTQQGGHSRHYEEPLNLGLPRFSIRMFKPGRPDLNGDEAIQEPSIVTPLGCFASLAMTVSAAAL
jgi:hypothetical protein